MSKGSGNRTKNRKRYREEFDRIHAKWPAFCQCQQERQADNIVRVKNANCPIHGCPYCDGTGKRFSGDKCDHRPRRF